MERYMFRSMTLTQVSDALMQIVHSFVKQQQQQQQQQNTRQQQTAFDSAAELSLLPGLRHKVKLPPPPPIFSLLGQYLLREESNFAPNSTSVAQLGELFQGNVQPHVRATQLQVVRCAQRVMFESECLMPCLGRQLLQMG
jgi:hypothetical protein